MDYTSVSLRLHAPCRDGDKMNRILWLYSRSFFFLFSSQVESIFSPLHYVAWCECGIVFFAFELLHKQFICYFFFLKGGIFCLSQRGVAHRESMYTYTFLCFVNDISDSFGVVLLYSWNTRTHLCFALCSIATSESLRKWYINTNNKPLYSVGPITHSIF